MRREYALRVTINGRALRRVIIDSHYEEKHGESMNDRIILELVKELDGHWYVPHRVKPDGHEIHVTDPVQYQGKPYRLVWTIHPREDFVGIINAFRR